jgi:hypothetical protein
METVPRATAEFNGPLAAVTDTQHDAATTPGAGL